jgi:SMC interacting uncharacterized protein involved in chromosome segregation
MNLTIEEINELINQASTTCANKAVRSRYQKGYDQAIKDHLYNAIYQKGYDQAVKDYLHLEDSGIVIY